jgi:hypothetical protein
MTELPRKNRIDQFFWLSLSLLMIGAGVAQVLEHERQKDDFPRLTLDNNDHPTKRPSRIDPSSTASIPR